MLLDVLCYPSLALCASQRVGGGGAVASYCGSNSSSNKLQKQMLRYQLCCLTCVLSYPFLVPAAIFGSDQG